MVHVKLRRLTSEKASNWVLRSTVLQYTNSIDYRLYCCFLLCVCICQYVDRTAASYPKLQPLKRWDMIQIIWSLYYYRTLRRFFHPVQSIYNTGMINICVMKSVTFMIQMFIAICICIYNIAYIYIFLLQGIWPLTLSTGEFSEIVCRHIDEKGIHLIFCVPRLHF